VCIDVNVFAAGSADPAVLHEVVCSAHGPPGTLLDLLMTNRAGARSRREKHAHHFNTLEATVVFGKTTITLSVGDAQWMP
jgi:hypothetical protein